MQHSKKSAENHEKIEAKILWIIFF